MKPISKTSERIKQPTIVRVPAHDEKKPFSVEEAESFLRKEGFRPLSKKFNPPGQFQVSGWLAMPVQNHNNT